MTFTFDALGRHATRVLQTTPTSTDTYHYVGSSETAWRIETGSGPTRTSGIGPDLARLSVGDGTSFAWTLPDLHGSTAAGANAAETVISHAWRYDGYGRLVDDEASGVVNPWLYQGRLQLSPDVAHPLYEFSARFYDPNLGVFTQLDSYAGAAQDPMSLNRYLYAAANPATLIDPTGHAYEEGVGADGGSAAPVGTPAVKPIKGPSWTSASTSSLTGMAGGERDSYVRRHGGEAVSLLVHSRFTGFNVAEHPIVLQLAYEHLLNQNLPTNQLEVLYDSLVGYIPEGHVVAAAESAFLEGNSEVQWLTFSLQSKGTLGMIGELGGVSAVAARSAGVVARSMPRSALGASTSGNGLALPAALRGGASDVHAYYGVSGGSPVYVGITNDIMRRQGQHGSRFLLEPITTSPVTRGEARAIEEAVMLRNPNFQNIRHSISPKHAWYADAAAWGEDWLRRNGL